MDRRVLTTQVRELEKQLGQTQSRPAAAASAELSVRPDPRKLSAQEKNLLRIRNLEREKQDGWEVMCAPGEVSAGRGTRGRGSAGRAQDPGEVSGACGTQGRGSVGCGGPGGDQLGTWDPEITAAPARTRRYRWEAGDTWGFGSPLCMFLMSCPS